MPVGRALLGELGASETEVIDAIDLETPARVESRAEREDTDGS